MTLKNIKHSCGVHRNYLRNFINGVYNTSLNYKALIIIFIDVGTKTSNVQTIAYAYTSNAILGNYIPIPAATLLMSRVQWKSLGSIERLCDYGHYHTCDLLLASRATCKGKTDQCEKWEIKCRKAGINKTVPGNHEVTILVVSIILFLTKKGAYEITVLFALLLLLLPPLPPQTKIIIIILCNIPGKQEIKELQKTAVLGTEHIQRKVLK